VTGGEVERLIFEKLPVIGMFPDILGSVRVRPHRQESFSIRWFELGFGLRSAGSWGRSRGWVLNRGEIWKNESVAKNFVIVRRARGIKSFGFFTCVRSDHRNGEMPLSDRVW